MDLIDFIGMSPYNLWRNILTPFLLVFIILWAVLKKINIFDKKINFVISLGISFMLATSNAFVIMSTYITEVSGYAMIIVFGLVIAGGTMMWGMNRGKTIYYDQNTGKLIRKLNKKIGKLRKKYRSKKDPAILDEIDRLKERVKRLEEKQRIKEI